MEVVITVPTTRARLPPTRFTTNGAPSPVEIPDNSKMDKASWGEKRVANKYIITGAIISFTIDNLISSLGFRKTESSSLVSSRTKFKNRMIPRKSNRYCEKILPTDENKTPPKVEDNRIIMRMIIIPIS